jgi:hypothetical protein
MEFFFRLTKSSYDKSSYNGKITKNNLGYIFFKSQPRLIVVFFKSPYFLTKRHSECVFK